jgi:serine/threonine protein phosphatase PrpC
MNTTKSEHGPTATLHSRQPLVVQSFGLSDRGQERPANEDRFLILDLPLYVGPTSLPHSDVPQGGVFLVADGMGGHPAGEVASSLAIEAVEEFLPNCSKRSSSLEANEEHDPLKELEGAFVHANARIFEETVKHPQWRGMGTTLTAAFVVDGKLFVAHVGHTRCYLWRRGELRQLTQDHTIAAELVRLGIVSPKDAPNQVYRHVVSNILGGPKPMVQVELHELDLHPDDVILLCSDGLTEMVSDARIAAILRDEREPRRACERLVAEANQRGGKKNITVIVAQVEPGDDEPYAPSE